MITRNEQTIIAYRYRCTVAENVHEALHGGHDVTEFFIPSISLCFNNEGILFSVEPRNHDGMFEYQCPTALTKVYLPASLVNKLNAMLNSHSVTNEKELLVADQEIKNLFSNQSVSIQEGGELKFLDPRFLHDEKYFTAAYQAFGNDALPAYIKKYLNGVTPHQATIDCIFKIIASLDEVEKNSLKKCLINKLKKTNPPKVNSQDEPFEIPIPAIPSVVGFVTGCIASRVSDNPMVSFGVGTTSAAMTLFGQYVYDHYQKNQLKNQLDKLKKLIFDLLEEEKPVQQFSIN
jgi:hypothetical protein